MVQAHEKCPSLSTLPAVELNDISYSGQVLSLHMIGTFLRGDKVGLLNIYILLPLIVRLGPLTLLILLSTTLHDGPNKEA